MLVLDINDVETTLLRDGDIVYREPGVAFVDKDGAMFGREALSRSRLHPRQSHNEFWQRLNGDPVAPPGRGAANQADLVYLQLLAMREALGLGPPDADRPALVVAAPGTVTAEQFAVLLGIAAEAGFEVHTIVDAAVAAACLLPLSGSCRLLDLSLHRGLVTHLDIDPGQGTVRRTSVDEIPAIGLASLIEGWVDVVADRFVDGTRFDPLRIAETEQRVFDQVVAGIEVGDAELVIEVVHDEVARRVTVARHALGEKSRQRYELLARSIGDPGTLVMSHRMRRLPGLAGFLQDAGHELLPLAPDAVVAGIAESADQVQPDGASESGRTGARLVTSLPSRSAESQGATSREPPTHLLCAAVAIPLGETTNARDHPGCKGTPGFRVLRANRGFSVAPAEGADVALNGSHIDYEHPAEAGDRIVAGGQEFQLISVADQQDR